MDSNLSAWMVLKDNRINKMNTLEQTLNTCFSLLKDKYLLDNSMQYTDFWHEATKENGKVFQNKVELVLKKKKKKHGLSEFEFWNPRTQSMFIVANNKEKKWTVVNCIDLESSRDNHDLTWTLFAQPAGR